MIVISYDIKDNKLRSQFSKLIQSNGAIRLQYSVYEVVSTQRLFDNLVVLVEEFCRKFITGSDSILIFDVNQIKIRKYGSSIHRDQDVVYF